ncbi:MAG: hypothetical protein ACQES9_13460, partial [Myxococcota bacterium]
MAKKRKRRRKQKDKQKKDTTNSNEKSRLDVDVASSDSNNNDSQRMRSGSLGVVKKENQPEEQRGVSGSIVGLASGEISLNPNDPLKVSFDAPDKSIMVESEAAVEESPFSYQDDNNLSPGSKKSTLRLKLNQQNEEDLSRTPVPGRKRKKKSESRVKEERVPSKTNSKVDKAKFVPDAHKLPFVDLKKQPQSENREVSENHKETSEHSVSSKANSSSESKITEASSKPDTETEEVETETSSKPDTETEEVETETSS